MLGNKLPEVGIKELFDAGISYMRCGEYAFAYSCFCMVEKADLYILYNKALCCFMVSWFEECYALLKDAERQLPYGTDCYQRELPEIFRRWEYENSLALCPMPNGIPISLTTTQVLRLKAEAAFKLQLYSEVKSISARLRGKYKHINELLKHIDNGNL